MPSRAILIERILPIGTLALALVAVPVMFFSRSGLHRLNGLREERRVAQQEASKLSQEIRELRVQVADIKGDPTAIERAARDQLGLVRQTELVFQFDQ